MTGIRDAWKELTVLAAAMRPDWDHNDAWGAIHACRDAGWPFERAAKETWRLIWDPDGMPAELRSTARDTRPKPRTGPEAYQRGHRLWRDALGIPDDSHVSQPDEQQPPQPGAA